MPVNRTLKMTIEYDGTGFSGYQVQPGRRTVQQSVEKALEIILGSPVRIVAAGRTDAGVHAVGQVVSFSTGSSLEPRRLTTALNGVLPPDIAVVAMEEAPPGFNARFDAISRSYRYTITDRKISIGRSHAWRVRYCLERGALEESTRPLEGECDLRGFSRKNETGDYSTVIMKNSWTFEDNFMIFDIRAMRFFHHAVRSIVGTAVDVARGKLPPDTFARILETGDRSLAGTTAPAHGLCLVSVDYGEG